MSILMRTPVGNHETKRLWILSTIIMAFMTLPALHAQTPYFSWIETAGGVGYESLWDMAVDPSGNCYVVGSFNQTATFDGTDLISQGYTDIYIAKYDSSGELVWAKGFGSSDYNEAQCVAVDADTNILVAGAYGGSVDFETDILSGASNIFILKMDPDGNVLWARQAGGPGNESVRDIVLDEADNIYLTGKIENNAQFGPYVLTTGGNQSAFVAKYNTAGQVQWAYAYGGGTWLGGYAITMDPAGFLRVTGRFTEQITLDGITLNSQGSWDGFIMKQTQNGTVLWAKGFGGLDNETMHGIASDDAGNTVITGFFGENGNPVFFDEDTLYSINDLSDILVAKFDSSGNMIWAKAAGGPFPDTGFDVTMDGIGNSYVTGRFRDSTLFADTTLISAGNGDIFIVKYDPEGEIVWIKRAGGTTIDEGHSIVLHGSNDLYVGGFFSGSANFDRTTKNSAGNDDIFVSKLDQPLSGIPSGLKCRPTALMLYQNYPNPFNPATTIQYDLTEVSSVKLNIYNIRGQRITQLVNAIQDAGPHTVRWAAVRESDENCPSGIYFYELKTGSHREVRKMFLLK